MTRAGAATPGMVLDVERTIGPDATRTHIPFPFTLDRAASGIEIAFSYHPKALTDKDRARMLVEEGMRAYADSMAADDSPDRWLSLAPLTNLLTLSLDGPSGFRGCAHRQSREQRITVARETATPGFLPGNVEAGPWKVTISVHLVVSEACGFRVQVRAL